MSPLTIFVLGLLAGWLIEWVIDALYWRRRYQTVTVENVPSKKTAAHKSSRTSKSTRNSRRNR